jgi:hypothetical protein
MKSVGISKKTTMKNKLKDFLPRAVYVIHASAKGNPKREKQLAQLRAKILGGR